MPSFMPACYANLGDGSSRFVRFILSSLRSPSIFMRTSYSVDGGGSSTSASPGVICSARQMRSKTSRSMRFVLPRIILSAVLSAICASFASVAVLYPRALASSPIRFLIAIPAAPSPWFPRCPASPVGEPWRTCPALVSRVSRFFREIRILVGEGHLPLAPGYCF